MLTETNPATIVPAQQSVASIPPPEQIFSCPSCQHWIADGVLACPDCGTLVYAQHLNTIGAAAAGAEAEGRLVDARALWQSALQWLPADASQADQIRAHIATLSGREHAEEERQSKWKKRLGPLFPIFVLAAKLKSAFFLIFKLKFLLGFVGYFGLYWALFGWKFAIGFVLSILIHEAGHYVAVRRRGLKADLPVLLPGLGAYVRWYNEGLPLADLASIALAGPIFGLGAAFACLGLFLWTHHPVFEALAYTGALINLFNLLPVFWLDGAQAALALNRLGRGLILATCILLFALMREGVFLLLGAGAAWKLFTPDAPEENSIRTLTVYVGLLIVLGGFLYLLPDPGAVRR